MVQNYLKFIGFFTLLSGNCFAAEGGMPQLNPDYWISQILTDLNEAQKLKDQSEKKISEYNKILSDAKQDAKKILDETRKRINRDIENKKNQFNLEIDKEIENAEKEIKMLKLSSIKDINKIAIEASSEIIKKVVGTEVNASSVSAIVEDISKKKLQNIYDN